PGGAAAPGGGLAGRGAGEPARDRADRGGQQGGDLLTLDESGPTGRGGRELEAPRGPVPTGAVGDPALGLERHHAAPGGPVDRALLVEIERVRLEGRRADGGVDLDGLAAPLRGVAHLGDDLPDARRGRVDLDRVLVGVDTVMFTGHLGPSGCWGCAGS